MTSATAIIATQDAEDFAICQRAIAGMEGLHLKAHCPGLMELFSKVESEPPDLVLISDALTQDPNFEVIVNLFDTLDVRWARVSNGSSAAHGASPMSRTKTGGLFPVALDGPEHVVRTQLMGVLSAQKRPRSHGISATQTPAREFKRMILIGASTGGVDALKVALSDFGPDCPPTVVVQHTGQGFGSGLVAVLARTCRANVKIFAARQPLQAGTIYIVAGLPHHAVLTSESTPHLETNTDDLVSGHRPSIDKMFNSAVPHASRVVATILTGMGRDGVDGLLALRKAGAQTFAQDEASSVVYGMPALAWKNGAAMQQVALKDMGQRLLAEAKR